MRSERGRQRIGWEANSLSAASANSRAAAIFPRAKLGLILSNLTENLEAAQTIN